MIHDLNDDIPAFDDAVSEREWLAQERAMRSERLHLGTASEDSRALRYRMLARTLRQPLPEGLPPDFAAQVTARIATDSARRHVPVPAFEFGLVIVLAITFLVAGGAVVALYGSQWLPSIIAMLPAPSPSASRWLLAFASCIGLSWLLAQWPSHGHERSPG